MNRITPLFLLILFLGISLSSLSGQTSTEPVEDSLSVQQPDVYQTPPPTPWSWTVHKLDGNFMRWQPEHKLEYSLTHLPGVLSMNNELLVRGSLAGEIGYFLDGISITNPLTNSAGIPLILESIESIDLHTGAYGSQFGGANGALAHITMRKGTDAIAGNVDVQTDDFASPGESFLGAGSNGYRRIVGTAQGSVAGVRFFAAAQHRYLRNRQPMFLEPFRFEGLTTDQFGSWPEGTPLPGPIEFQRNYLYNNWLMENALQGNLVFSLEPFEIRAFGNYSFEEHPEENDWSSALENYFRQREMMNKTRTLFGALQVSHKLSESASYTVIFSGYNRFNEILDPDFGDEWILYHDSLASREKGYVMSDGSTGFQTRFYGPQPYSIINAFSIAHPFAPNNYYAKNNQSSYSLSLDATTDILPLWKIRGGGKIDWWTMRMYRISDIRTYATFFFRQPPPPLTESERRDVAFSEGSITAYGYDYEGVETDNKLDPPRTPQFLSLFLDNEYVIDAFTLRLGGRYERFGSGALLRYVPLFGNNLFPPPSEQTAVGYFLPRLSVSFQPSAEYSFYAAFGKYAQLPVLENFLNGSNYVAMSGQAAAASTDSYVRPLRSTQYEVGGTVNFGKTVAFSTRLYYKSHFNLPTTVLVFDEQGGAIFTAFAVVEKEAISQGLELSTRATLIDNVSFATHYVLSDWRRLGSTGIINLASGISGISGSTDLRPDQRIVASFDYHSADDNSLPRSGVFRGIGFTILFTAESGLPYTKVAEPQNLGQATAWNIGVRPLIDPRTRNPVEPINSSSTPWIYYVDLKISADVMIGSVQTEFYAAMLNVLNTKNILNIYPTTGSADNDGWLDSQASDSYKGIPGYAAFYSAINLKNHWAFSEATGLDMYGTPRQLRIGMRVSL